MPIAAAIAGTPDLRRRIERLRQVPTLPRLVERVVAALDDSEIDLARVGELIEVDQALTAQILRLANSAFYGAQGRTTHVAPALILLGTTVTRSLVLTSAVFDRHSVGLRGFWEHSIGCAVAAGALAKVTGRVPPEEASAAGLLHDLGKVILYRELPDDFADILARAKDTGRSFRAIELERLGVDHAEIASWLTSRWHFPPELAEPIAFHHHPSRAWRAADHAAIVHLADVLVRAVGFGDGGDPLVPEIDASAWNRFDLTPQKLDLVLEQFDFDLDHALNHALFD
jgi:putative nucleotidyltransferase with HDIG domain